MPKKFLSLLIAVMFVMMPLSTIAGASETKNYNVRVFVDENEVLFDSNSGRPYINKDNRTMLPFRKVAEAAKAEVTWIAAENKAVAKNNANTVEMIVGKKEFIKNGSKTAMDTEMALEASEGRTYAPFRAISEGLGYQVDFARAVQKPDNTEILVVFNFTRGQSKEEQQIIIEKTKNNLQSPETGNLPGEPDLRYEGELIGGKAGGAGKLYSGNQLIYDGMFAEGLASGNGVLYKNGLVHFAGVFADGKPVEGVIYNSNGTKLFYGNISYWDNEGFYGVGELYSDKSKIYKGEVVIQSGKITLGNQGSLFYDTGELFYQGDLYGDVPFGNGVFYSKEGEILFEGAF